MTPLLLKSYHIKQDKTIPYYKINQPSAGCRSRDRALLDTIAQFISAQVIPSAIYKQTSTDQIAFPWLAAEGIVWYNHGNKPGR